MTVADMFRPVLLATKPRIAPGHDFSSISGEFRFRSRTSFRRFDHHEYGLAVILGRWKFLYHIDSDFTVLVKERKKSADLKTAESETEIPVSVFRTRYSGSSSLFVL
jgi:hypothetical protein